MLILKFGGTSVGNPQAINRVIGILKDKDHKDKVQAVVVSAFNGVTDSLIAMAGKASRGDISYREEVKALNQRHKSCAAAFLKGNPLKNAQSDIKSVNDDLCRILDGVDQLRELSPRTMDSVMSFGERLSASIIARIFCANGIEAEYLDARALIKTDDRFGKAQFLLPESNANIRSFFDSSKRPLQVVTGFIASTKDGYTTTLGRGGSDLSAAIFSAALSAAELEIWTDVDGIMTADPKLVKNAFLIDELSYIEAMEISHFGAKVLFLPSIMPVFEKGIPIIIRNTFNPSSHGTRIVKNAAPGKFPIRGISSISNVALLRIQGSGMIGVAGFSARVFGALAARGISVILITQNSSEYSICFAVLPEDARNAETALKEEFAREISMLFIDKPIVEAELSIIAVVGSKMKRTSGISGRVFHALGRNGINVIAIAQGSSELNISSVISRQDEGKALNAIHEAFFLSGQRSVNLFLVGTGLIGGTLLEQLSSQREILAAKHKIKINLVGAANSRKMMFRREGLDSKKVKTMLNDKEKTGDSICETFNISAYIEKMVSFNLPNTCFCDCTASEDVSAVYGKIIQQSIPIVTPNKRANAGSLEYYQRLTSFSRERGIPYLYETTVCAGLPVISTLRDLFLSGDRVIRIEAVLSGTLSYIFNNFDGKKTFSALVREAKAKGYTEPDPRDDLNAMDAARKALILARECGLYLEFANVNIEPILPAACFKAKDTEAFFGELEKSDKDFEKRRAEAAAKGLVLRYVAIIEEGSAKLFLRGESETSHFRFLTDSDNIVVLTTERYSKLPMVIKGPGAGAQVTAGGIFADIARIARTLV
ncbi:MAG: bifunctional aspartate kinase/homoserine dehydrogenase I [Treponema sp.]|nr:bifunctional aspartate kinase/homoserine dehydrogenase I [Treponema sp.]